MGWLSSIFGGSEKPSDPLSKLDPNLREFLQRESPVKYTPNQASSPPPAQHEHSTAEPATSAQSSKIPSASLYQDGRYAHLWKSYRPLKEIESESATDHDKLMMVLEGFKERKAALGRAALENCALQQEEWANCMNNGSWQDQLQMCKHQVRRFERCYAMQSEEQKFLRALGYGSVLERSAQVEEDIQMHADALYQRMLSHEAAVKQAKEDGKPIPTFDPGLDKAAAGRESAVAPTEAVEQQWKSKLDKLPEEERLVEEAALRADLQAKSDMARNIKQIRASQKEERDARRAQGQATLGDFLTDFFSAGGGEGKK